MLLFPVIFLNKKTVEIRRSLCYNVSMKGEVPMAKSIKHLYIVHHSHTDIGYTDLQERVIYRPVSYTHLTP